MPHLAPNPSGAPDDRPVYLHAAGVPPFFAMHHPPAGRTVRTAVVLCPPFGYDHLCAYRGLRAWARALAEDGHPVLRLDLPGGGDSAGGPLDDGLVATWTGAVEAAVRWLRAESGAPRVAAIGIGLGGLLAHRAAAAGAPIDDLILWATPSRGRAFVRELRAFSRLGVAPTSDEHFDPVRMPPLPQGAIEAGGFLLAADTQDELKQIDLAAAPLPPHPARRALVLGRDDITPDERLADALRAAGVELAVGEGPGYAALLESPHLSTPPWTVIARTAEWLAEAPETGAASPAGEQRAVTARDVLELREGGTAIRERPLRLATPHGRAFGILAEPSAGRTSDLCVVLLNVGAERRIGPNRMWVELARRWAARGVPVLRLDAMSIGDADGADALGELPLWFLYDERYREHQIAVFDRLEQAGLPGRFVTIGVCSGAYWAFQLAVSDARVAAALPVNSRFLTFNAQVVLEEDVEGQPIARPPVRPTWRDRVVALSHSRPAQPLRAFLRRPLPRAAIRRVWGWHTRGDRLDQWLDQLRDREQVVALRLTPGEALYPELLREGRLDRIGRWPNFSVEVVDGPPFAHTLQVVRLQPYIHGLLDASLEREVARAPRTPPRPAGRCTAA